MAKSIIHIKGEIKIRLWANIRKQNQTLAVVVVKRLIQTPEYNLTKNKTTIHGIEMLVYTESKPFFFLTKKVEGEIKHGPKKYT